jgi:hypothetical protein
MLREDEKPEKIAFAAWISVVRQLDASRWPFAAQRQTERLSDISIEPTAVFRVVFPA